MANDQNDQAVAPKKSPVLIIVLVVNLVAILGLGAFFLLRSTSAGAAQPEAAAPAAPMMMAGGMVGAPIDPETFATATMAPYIVNLREDGGTRYLKVSMTLRLRAPEITESFKKVLPAIRDRFISHLTDLTLEDLSGTKQKIELKKSLVELANETLGRMDVVDVYFTEFVIQ